jgi:diadenosine tetraphosphate (Ap4A) HIT family hydrolase
MHPSSPFELHSRLAADSIGLGRFRLSRLLLMNERRYPWFILVPERAGLTEIHQLPDAERHLLADESAALSRFLAEAFRADKLNIAAIGNLVPQLHLHHVVRFRDDAAWPGPVWGRFEPLPYEAGEIEAIRARVRAAGLADYAPDA